MPLTSHRIYIVAQHKNNDMDEMQAKVLSLTFQHQDSSFFILSSMKVKPAI